MERQNLNVSQWLWWTERDSVLVAYYDSSTDTVDVSIEGGGGTSAGTRINYPDGTKSPFMLSMAHITQNMTLNDTTTGEDLDCNLVIAESQMVIDAGIGLTIGDGKKVLTDLYDIYQ